MNVDRDEVGAETFGSAVFFVFFEDVSLLALMRVTVLDESFFAATASVSN
jgi:hypothetical protein